MTHHSQDTSHLELVLEDKNTGKIYHIHIELKMEITADSVEVRFGY